MLTVAVSSQKGGSGKRAIGWRWILVWVVVLPAVVLVSAAVVWFSSRLSDPQLQRWANLAQVFQGVVGLLTLASILWAVIRYRRAAEDQRKAKHFQAWQAISDAQGKSGSGGRCTALEDLHNDGVSLVGVELTGGLRGGAYLAELQLPGADLSLANLQGASLWKANLRRARLYRAALDSANLREADLREASLVEARLSGADLTRADLRKASLANAQIQSAILSDANLEGVDLANAKLQSARLMGTNLREATLTGAYLAGADLSTALGLTRDQICLAKDWSGAKLPEALRELERPTA